MKNVRRFGKFFACGLFTFLFIFTNISCEIGLGEAVDIDRPTISISYPPKNAVIRDTFVLSGNTGDDKGVNFIKVTAKNASTGKTYEKTIQMNGMTDGQWKINLNDPLDVNGKVVDPTDPTSTFDHWEFSDAKYTIDVIAYDFQNKDSGAASITLEIDNTAPDFTATLLGTTNRLKPTEYGSSLKVTGTVDEAHEISTMEMKVYNINAQGEKTSTNPITVLEGTEQKPIIQNDVPTTGGIEVIFADATKSGLLKDRYEALYGQAVTASSSDTKNLLTELVLTDNAKEYKNPSSGVTNDEGNKTTKFNLKEDNLTGIEQAYFSLNPSNNPKFNIGAYAYHTGEANGPDNANASNNTSVSVSFTSGRDNVNINPASLRVYLVGPIEKTDYDTTFADEVYSTDRWLTESYDTVTEDGATVDVSKYTVSVPASFTKFKPSVADTPATGYTRVKELKNKRDVAGDRYYLDSSAESLSYDYQIGENDLTSGKYYLIVAVGQDQNGVSLVHSDTYYYGFKAQTTGKDPDIEITTRPAVKSGKYTNNSSLTYKGTAKADGTDKINKIIYRVRVMDGRTEVYSQNIEHVIDYVADAALTPATEVNWEFTFNLLTKVTSYDPNKVYDVEVYVKAEDSGERKSSDKYESLIVDQEKPTFEFTNIVPSLTYTGLDNVERKGVVNGDVEVFFEAKDLTNFDKWEYELYIGDTKQGSTVTEHNTSGSISFPTASNAAFDKKNVEIKVKAYDVAGNVFTYSSNDYFKKVYGTTGSYYIDQDSDKPQITISAKESVTNLADVKEGDNLYSVSGSKAPSITTTVTDDDQLNKVWAMVKKEGASWTPFYEETFAANEKTKTVQIYLTSDGKKDGTVWAEGKYYVQIFASDGNVENKTKQFALGITKKRPVVKVTTTSGKYYNNPHSVAVAGTIDENVTDKLEVTYTLDDRTTGTTVTTPKTKTLAANAAAVTALAGKFTDTISIGTADTDTIKVSTLVKDGTLTASYVGYDSYGQPSVEAIFTYLIDGKDPTVDGKTTFKWSDGSAITSDWTNKNTIKLNSTPEDKTPAGENGSGIASIQYGVFNHSPLNDSDKSDATKWTTVASGADRNVTLDDGTSYIFMRATDNAGNTAYTSTPQTVKVDTANPVIALSTLADNVDGTAALTISGTASDNAGLASSNAIVIEVTGNKASDGTSQTLKPTVTGTTSFSATLTAAQIQTFAEGKFTVKATAKDVIGNTTSDSKDIVYDTLGPRLEILTPVAGEWQNSTAVKVTGTITDYSTDGLAVYYAFGTGTYTEPALPTKANATTAANWTSNGWKAATVKNGAWNFTPANPAFSEKENKVYVRAVDKYGNITAAQTSRIVKVDNANPVIVKTNYKKDGGSAESLTDVASIILDKNKFELTGTYSDSASNVTLSATRKLSAGTSANVTITGTPASGTALSGTWKITESTGLSDGVYEYEIIGTDETNKSGSTTLTVTVDTTNPAFVADSMKVSSTKDGLSASGSTYGAAKWYPNTPIFLSGKWTENGSGIDYINYWIKTTEADPAGTELSTPTGTIIPSKDSNGKWTFEQSLDFSLGNNWVYMKAVDVAGNEEASFAKFKINMDNEAPTLVLDQTGNLYKKDSDTLTISGKVTDNKSGVNSTYAIRIFAGDYDAEYKNNTTPSGQIVLLPVNASTGVKADGTFSVDVSLATIKSKAGTKDLYKICVVASDAMEYRTTKDFTLYRDNAGPSIKRDSITTLIDESASGGKAYTVNGKVTIKGDSTDAVEDVSETTVAIYAASGITVNATTGAVSGLSGKTAKATYKKNKTTETPDATGTIVANSGSTLKKWNYTIDTLKFSTLNGTGDNTEYVIVITAKDGSGNESTYGEKIFVKQSTDLPKVTPSNYTGTITAAANIKLGSNLFDKNGNKSLMASITDDDKLDSVKVEYHAAASDTAPAANSTGWKTFFTSGTGLNSATYTLTAPLVKGGNGADKNDALAVGKYFIRITATDNNSPAVTSTTTPFLIAVDNTAPVIESVQINNKDVTENTYAAQTHTVVFTVSDDTEPARVEFTTNGGTSWSSTGVTSTGSGTSKTFSHLFTVANANVATFTGYQYRVVDVYGRETGKTLKYKMDVTKPVVSTTNVKVKSKASGDVAYSALGTTWFNGDSVTVTATDVVSDANLVRDVAVTISGDTTDSEKTIGLDISGSNPLKGSFTNTRSLDDGISTIKYVFKDEAELKGTMDVTVRVDKTAPVLKAGTSATVKAGSTPLTTSGNVYTNASNVTVDFTATDVFGGSSTETGASTHVSGLAKAYIGTKEGFADSEAIKTITLSGQEAAIPSTDKTLDISSYNNELQLYLRLEDNAGNKSSDVKIADFKIDRVAPTVRIDPVKDADGVSTNGTQVNKTITLSGEVVEDNLKDGKVYLYIDPDSNTTVAASAEIGNDKKWSIEYNTSSLSKAEHTFKVETEDKAGVKGEASVVLYVDQDTDRPIVTFEKIDPAASTAAAAITLNEGTLEGTISDDDDETNIVKKLEFKLVYTYSGTSKTIAWAPATITGDKWSYTINNPDGTDFTYTLYTRVTDNNDAVFSTDSADSSVTGYAGKPKLLQAGSTTANEDAFIFNVDNTPPTIGTLQVAVKANGAAAYGDFENWADNQKFGGKTKEKIKIKIPASDAITTDVSELTVTVKIGENDEVTLSKANNYDSTGKFWFCEIDFSSLGQNSDTLVIQIGVADKSGKPSTVNPYLIVDNLGPTEIENVTPSKNTAMTGTVEVTGSVKDNDNGSGVQTIYYYVPEYAAGGTKPTNPATVAANKWIAPSTDAAQTTLKYTEGGSTFSVTLNYLNNGTEIVSKYAGWASNGLYQIPVWFKMVDAFGNVGYNTENSIKYDPNADKPTLKVLNPTEDSTLSSGTLKDGTKNYVVLGGIVNVQGTAYDDEGISGVYVQYDINGNGSYMDATDLAWLQKTGDYASRQGDAYEVKTLEDWTKADALIGESLTKLPNDRKGDMVVKAKGTTSWSAAFQTNDLPAETTTTCLEIGNTKNTSNRTLNIRICTVDADTIDAVGQCVSGWDVVHVSVNRSIPQMALKLKRYSSDNPAANEKPIEIKDYTKDMYISGQHWFLEGDVTDTDGIDEIAYTNGVFYQGPTSNTGYTGNAVVNKAAVAATGHATVIAGSSGKNFHLRIPVVTSTNTDNNYYENITRFTLTVTAYDRDGNGNQRKNTRENFYINIDNTAPAFYKDEDGDGKPTTAAFAVYQDGYGGTELNPSAYIRNSSGPQMTIGSAAMEEGSGFDKAVFYLKRTGKKKVYNIMESSSNATVYVDARDSTDTTKVYIKDYLPVREMTVTATSNTLTASGIGSNANIRVGGLVYFGGAYRTISGKSGDTVTLSEQVDTTDTTAYFVYASVVDNMGEDGSTAKDDGDGLFESLIYMNNFIKWDATFNTANIPDGPIELHVLVFDKAGNVNHSSVSTRIWNNPLRLAKVTIGTDLNGDNEIVKDDGETSVFEHTKRATSDADYYRADGNYYDKVWNISYDDAKFALKDDKSIDWKIKNKLYVRPEFVGGNGDIFYKYKKEVGNGDGKKLTSALTGDFSSVTAYTNNAVLGKLEPNHKTNGYIELPNDVIDATKGEYSGEGPVTPNTYQFSFWDSTDDLKPGSTSQWTVLNIELAQDLEDTIAPKVTIKPFFWNGRGLPEEGKEPLNSLQWEGADGEYTALGHIELASDAETWKGEKVTPTGESDTTFGNDPKVSGKIVIRGTASDETILKKLKFSFDSLTMTNCEVSYDSEHKGWGTYVAATDAQGTEGEEGYQPAVPAHFTMPSSSSEDWSINIIDADGPTQTGHSIKWELYIDTAKLTGKVGLNKNVKVKAYDGTNWSTNKQENTYAANEQYQMDVVPYVVEVDTELSSLNANASIYNRTALGHYPVRGAARNTADNTMNTTTGETITLKGFNLNGTASGNYETVTKSVDSRMASGMFVPKVNGIPAINNINNNNAKGAYTGNITNATGKGADYDSDYETLVEWAYNRLPNNENNNLLNDDIYFDVWDINDRAAVPAQGKLEGVHMAIAPASSGYSNQNMIQFGAAFGNMMFGLGTTGDTPYSLASWNTRGTDNSDAIMVGGNGFHIDANGNTWGTNYNGEEIEVYAVVGSLFGTGDRANKQIGLEKFEQDSNRMKTRFQSTSMASTVGTRSTNLYLAYYDALNDQIRFRAGTIIETTAKTYGQLVNQYTSKSGGASYNTDIKNVQVIAGSSTRLGAGPSIVGNGKSRNAGNFVSIDVIKANSTGNSNGTDVVVAVWYDADTANGNKMMYSYTTTPLSNFGAATGNNGAIDKPADGWSDPEEIFIGGGEYCQVKVAADGSIHMAAYANGNLEYAYKRSYSGTTVQATVDSVYDTGTYITLDVALVDSNPVPYIGYYSGSKPKYAYLNKAGTYTVAGLSGVVSGSDLVNQNWEISVVPTASTLRLSSAEKINVGVWKTDKGVLNWSTKDGKDPGAESDAGTIGTTTWTRNGTSTTAQVYGNGTKNGVLAYVVNNKGKETTTCLETAQKRD